MIKPIKNFIKKCFVITFYNFYKAVIFFENRFNNTKFGTSSKITLLHKKNLKNFIKIDDRIKLPIFDKK